MSIETTIKLAKHSLELSAALTVVRATMLEISHSSAQWCEALDREDFEAVEVYGESLASAFGRLATVTETADRLLGEEVARLREEVARHG